MAVGEEIRGVAARPKLPTVCADSLCSNVPETCEDDDQNTTFQEQTLNGIADMAVQQKSHGKSLEGIRGPSLLIVGHGDGDQNTTRQNHTSYNDDGPEDCSEFDWSEKENCIKCSKGGNVLVCSYRNCPLAVHVECMRCAAHFDSEGKFYCPYCTYTQAMLVTGKAKKKAELANKALSEFLGGEMVDDGVHQSDEDFRANDIATASAVKEQRSAKRRKLGVEPKTSVDCSLDDAEAGEKEDDEEEVGGENPKIVDDLQNERVTGHDQEEVEIGKNPELGGEPEKDMEREVDSENNEEEDEEMEDGEEAVIGKNPELGVEPEKAMERELDGENNEEEDEDMEDGEEAVIGKNPELGVEPEKALERELDSENNEEEIEIGDGEEAVIGKNPELGVEPEKAMGRELESEMEDGEEAVIGKNPEIGVEPEKAMERELDGEHNEEETEMEDNEQEAAGPSKGERNCMGENDEVANDSIEDDSGFVTPKHTGNQNVNPTREADGEEVHEMNNNTMNNSKPSVTIAGFPILKRKRQEWTDEEVEVLKECVGKISAKVNKNIPWKKVLEVGQDKFHESRSADDLRGKWKRIMHSAK